MHLEENAFVDHVLDDGLDVIGLVGRVRDECVQELLVDHGVEVDIVVRRRVVEVVVRKVGQQRLRQFEAVLFVSGHEVCDA